MPGRLNHYNDRAFIKDAQTKIPNFNNRVGKLNAHYNIPPTSPIATLLNTGEYLYSHFGLIPSWAKQASQMQINARSENIFERKSFTESFRSRRCLIPVNGWFEWKVEDETKQPYYVYPEDKSYVALAGIWDLWRDPQTDEAFTGSAIITCEPNSTIETIHHRMPVILDQEDWGLWLDNNTPIEDLYAMLKPYTAKALAMHEVSLELNHVKYQDPSCIEFKKPNPLEQGRLF